MPPNSTILSLATVVALSSASFADDAFPPMPPVKAHTPAETIASIQLPPGYHLELVLSEPQIKEPVIASFDGDGRMFVAEMRSYMQDIEGKNELDPVSRVSLHWSSKGDGVYDQHTIFADNLKLPRMLLPLDKGRAIIGETDTNDLFIYTDTDGDGVSDKKEPFFIGGARGGNLEHQPNGLLWAIDNGIYSTYNNYRLRWSEKGAVKEPAAANNGQWGLCQDDHGKVYFVNAGGETGPMSFQVPVVYGAFSPKERFAPGFDVVWPLVGMADVQGGTGRFRPEDKTLNHFTATAGIEVYRGDRLPEELRGNVFFGEPVGRLVRRSVVESKGGLTTLSNPYQDAKSEFLRSTDPCFRPLNLTTAPDGTLYIVDMYRGIIQEGNWVREGAYLRKVVEQYAFQNVVGYGRIYRLVHDTTKPGPPPHMNDEKPAQLVAHLEHPNGWWRDTAQKLLILRGDKSVAPALAAMARGSKNYLAQMHALWTLEGLGALDAALVREKIKDANPQVRATAIRVSESLYQAGDKSFAADVQTMTADQDADVVIQAALTAKLLDFPNWKTTLETLAAANPSVGLKSIADSVLHPPETIAKIEFTPEQKKQLKAGEVTYQTLCTACHGADGKGMPMIGAAPGARLAPALAGSKTILGHKDGAIYVQLHGLVGDIDGKKYEGQMIAMATNDDAWIASVLSYVRNSFGNHVSFISPGEVAKLRVETKARTQPWTVAELRAAVPQPLTNRKEWKLTASHENKGCAAAIDGKESSRYTTNASQTPGMWFQIELPQEATVAGVELDSTPSPRDYPRGYKAELSTDGQKWTEVAKGKGNDAITEIEFPAAKAKFIRLTQTGAVDGLFWSIHELQVLAGK